MAQKGSIKNLYGYGSCSLPQDLYNGCSKTE